MKQFLRKTEKQIETETAIVDFYQEEINNQASKGEHSQGTINLIERQNEHRDYLILLEEMKQKLIDIIG